MPSSRFPLMLRYVLTRAGCFRAALTIGWQAWSHNPEIIDYLKTLSVLVSGLPSLMRRFIALTSSRFLAEAPLRRALAISLFSMEYAS